MKNRIPFELIVVGFIVCALIARLSFSIHQEWKESETFVKGTVVGKIPANNEVDQTGKAEISAMLENGKLLRIEVTEGKHITGQMLVRLVNIQDTISWKKGWFSRLDVKDKGTYRLRISADQIRINW